MMTAGSFNNGLADISTFCNLQDFQIARNEMIMEKTEAAELRQLEPEQQEKEKQAR